MAKHMNRMRRSKLGGREALHCLDWMLSSKNAAKLCYKENEPIPEQETRPSVRSTTLNGSLHTPSSVSVQRHGRQPVRY